MNSNFKVPLTQIKEIRPHGNAEKLEIAVVYGFQVVVKKDVYMEGDPVFYIPIDSIIPQKLEDHLFPADSKIKLEKRRVRQIRIRGLASQGMLIDPEDIEQVYGENFDMTELEKDYAEALGVIKYEPQVTVNNPGAPGSRKARKPLENPAFHQYNGLDNIKWYPEKFKADEIVVVQEKIHGTNARAALQPFVANTFLKKLKKFFGFAPENEFCYGSNTVQLQNRPDRPGYYGRDVYKEVFTALKVQEKLHPGESIYGEIYGDGIQKNYNYGLKGEQDFVLFDVKVTNEDGTQRWLNPDEVAMFADQRGFKMVPEVYRGTYNNLEFVKQFTVGASLLSPSQKVREGVVVKAFKDYDEYGNKRALKVISEAYLDDKSNTDFH